MVENQPILPAFIYIILEFVLLVCVVSILIAE